MPSKEKSVKDHVLNVLEARRGTHISGARIASELEVSRAAVWKAIEELRRDGYAISAVTKRGYILDEASDLLSPQGIAAHLRHSELAELISVYDTLESTNLTAKQMAVSGAPHGSVVAAVSQTSGRGRLGRSFFSPKDAGVYFTVILRPDQMTGGSSAAAGTGRDNAAAEGTGSAGADRTSSLDRGVGSGAGTVNPVLMTTAAAVAVSRAIEEVSGREVQIKWVNDLYLDGKKVCGILTEGVTNFETGTIESIVIGIGINCFRPTDDFPGDLSSRAASLFSFSSDQPGEASAAPRAFSKNALIAAAVDQLIDIQSELSGSRFMREYKDRSCVLGKEILFFPGGIPTATGLPGDDAGDNRGIVEDFDDCGGLVVRLADGSTKTLSTGEISIRPVE